MCERTAKLYSEPRLLALTPPGRHKAAHDDVMDTTRSQRITMRTLIRNGYRRSRDCRLSTCRSFRRSLIGRPVAARFSHAFFVRCTGTLRAHLILSWPRGSNAPTPDILCVRPLTDYYYNIFLPSKRRFFPASTWRLRALPPLNCLCSRRRVAPRCRCLTSAFSNRLYSLRRCRWPRCWLLVAGARPPR